MHLAIIMDGNGRWASERGLPRTAGHVRGASVARKLIEWAPDAGLASLTLYAFSTENWARPSAEINMIFRLIAKYIERNVIRLLARNMRVTFIGSRNGLPHNLCELMDSTQERTSGCSGTKLNIAINYGGRDEIIRICRSVVHLVQSSQMNPDLIDDKAIFALSDLAHGTSPDIILRTGGDRRLSNFLLWHAAYSELYFTSTLWPDFTVAELEDIIDDFTCRDRRFGGLSAKVNGNVTKQLRRDFG